MVTHTKSVTGKIVSMRPERLCNFSLFRFHPVLPTAQISLHEDGDMLFANTDNMSLSMHFRNFSAKRATVYIRDPAKRGQLGRI